MRFMWEFDNIEYDTVQVNVKISEGWLAVSCCLLFQLEIISFFFKLLLNHGTFLFDVSPVGNKFWAIAPLLIVRVL